MRSSVFLLVLFLTAVGCAPDDVVWPPLAGTDATNLPDVDTAGNGDVDAPDTIPIETECETDDDCDDGNTCTSDRCTVGHVCVSLAREATCADDATCSVGYCHNTTCELPVAPCEDGNPCTADACVEGSCDHSSAEGPCEDGDSCVVAEKCLNGKCVGNWACACQTDVECDDANPCTSDSCAPTGEVCLYAAVTGTCDDASVCTTADQCKQGACSGESTLVCDDGNPCTLDSCDPTGGCVTNGVSLNDALCDDGVACTSGDYCLGGGCVGGDSSCTCSDNSACDDANPCTQDECQVGICSNSATVCDDGNPCTQDSCEVSAGGCVATVLAAGTALNTTCAPDGCGTGEVKCWSGQQFCLWTGSAPQSDDQPCAAGKGVCQGGHCALADNHRPWVGYLAQNPPVKSGALVTISVEVVDKDTDHTVGYNDTANVYAELTDMGGGKLPFAFAGQAKSPNASLYTTTVDTKGLLQGVYLLEVHAVDNAGDVTHTVAPVYVYTGQVRHVGDGQVFPNIKSGIAAAKDGDLVLIHSGNYVGSDNRNVALWGKQILVMGELGPTKPVLNCWDQQSGFSLYNSGETARSVIARMEIRDCAGAVRMEVDPSGGELDARLVELDLVSNYGSYGGGGLYIVGDGAQVTAALVNFVNNSGTLGDALAVRTAGQVRIVSSTFVTNYDYSSSAVWGKPTGKMLNTELKWSTFEGKEVAILWDNGGKLRLVDCTSHGGETFLDLVSGDVEVEAGYFANHTKTAFSVSGGQLRLDNVLVQDNQTGMVVSCGSGEVLSSRFIANKDHAVDLDHEGCPTASWVFDNSVFRGNTALSYGAALQIDLCGNLAIRHCVFDDNHAVGYGGAIDVLGIVNKFQGELLLDNLLIANNSSELAGGGISLRGVNLGGEGPDAPKDQITIRGVTVTDNTAPRGGGIFARDVRLSLDYVLAWHNVATKPAPAGHDLFIEPDKGEELPQTAHFCAIGAGNSNLTDLGGELNGGVFGDIDGFGNIDLVDPLFVSAPNGPYALAQTATGDPAQSVCVDPTGPNPETAAGSSIAGRSTRKDGVADTGGRDIGYHRLGKQ